MPEILNNSNIFPIFVLPVNCKWPKFRYCYNFCCYITNKKISKKEAERLGLENIIQQGIKYYLKSKIHPNWGPCIFLDEDKRECSIYSKRPQTCCRYNCVSEPGQNLSHAIEEARYNRKKRGYDV